MKIHAICYEIEMPFLNFVDSWRAHNPDADIKIWERPELESALAQHGEPWMMDLYKYLCADDYLGNCVNMLRAFLLWKFGGNYFDLDVEALKPMISDDLILGNPRPPHLPPYVCNAVMGSAPGHPLWAAYMLEMKNRAGAIYRNSQVHARTGSMLLIDVVRKMGLLGKIREKEIFFPDNPSENSVTIHHNGNSLWTGKRFIGGLLHENVPDKEPPQTPLKKTRVKNMALWIKDKNVVPKEGWQYITPENGFVISVRGYSNLYPKIVEYYESNRKEPPSKEDVDLWLCQHLSIDCREGKEPFVSMFDKIRPAQGKPCGGCGGSK